MAQSKKTSTKRFGARYGRRLKDKLAPIEEASRKNYKCPYCSKVTVKRVSVGIWQCSKCNVKFASRAYHVQYAKKRKDVLEEKNVEENSSEELPDEIVAISERAQQPEVEEEIEELEEPEELEEIEEQREGA